MDRKVNGVIGQKVNRVMGQKSPETLGSEDPIELWPGKAYVLYVVFWGTH